MRSSDFAVASMMQLASAFGFVFAIIFCMHVVVMVWGRDRIERPTLYKWAVMLFAGSIAVPVIGSSLMLVMNLASSVSGLRSMDMGLGMAFGVVSGVVGPLMFAASIAVTFVALLPPPPHVEAARKKKASTMSSTLGSPFEASGETKPHPLDRTD